MLLTRPGIRHIFGVLMTCTFILMEGGWSFDQEEDDKAPNSWSSANVIDSTIIGFFIYILFIISSKSRLIPNLIFFGLLLLLYIINTQRSYWLVRKRISEQTNDHILFLELLLAIFATGALLYGFIDYVSYQQASYGNNFSWILFLLSSGKCKSLEKL